VPAWGAAVALGVLGVTLLAVYLQRLSIRFSLKALGEASGFWAIAGGGSAGPLLLTFVASAARPRAATLRCFGLRVRLEQRSATPAAPSGAKVEAAPEANVGERRSFWLRNQEPIDWGLFLVEQREVVTNQGVVVRASYDLSDIAMTGKLSAGLATLGAVLPAGIRLEQRAGWSGADTWSVELEGHVRVKLLSLLWHTARFMLAPPRGKPPASLEHETGAA
jgi:hypothetical protein